MFYIDLFRCLHTHDVRYLLAGGLAMNLHGVPRMTMDVDLVLALEDRNIDGFLLCAKELALRPQAPVPLESLKDPDQRRSWIEEKHLIAFGLASGQPGQPTVDILLRHELDFAAALGRAVVQTVEGVPINIASVEDLIAIGCSGDSRISAPVRPERSEGAAWTFPGKSTRSGRLSASVATGTGSKAVNDPRPEGGFGYWVSDEQLQAYSKLTPLERLQWLDEALRFILLARSEEVRERHERLRRGLNITQG